VLFVIAGLDPAIPDPAIRRFSRRMDARIIQREDALGAFAGHDEFPIGESSVPPQ
jgi:hypothetical protein